MSEPMDTPLTDAEIAWMAKAWTAWGAARCLSKREKKTAHPKPKISRGREVGGHVQRPHTTHAAK